MSLVVLLILAMVWAVFLVPQVVRARAEKTPADSIGAFRNQLSVLERSNPVIRGRGPVVRPNYASPSASLTRPAVRATREQVRRRRQAIVVRLLGAMAVTLLLGLLLRPVLYVHVLIDVMFVAYCAMLVRARSVAVERDTKVRYLPGAAYGATQPPLLLQQSGS